jgi:hypothetical protein
MVDRGFNMPMFKQIAHSPTKAGELLNWETLAAAFLDVPS